MRMRRLALSAVLLSIAAAAAAACNGGGGGLSMEEYFARVEQLSAEFDERQASLDDQLNRTLQEGSEREQVDATQESFSGLAEAMRAFRQALGEIDPPEGVAEAHLQAVRAFDDALDELEGLNSRLRGAPSSRELESALEEFDPDNNEAFLRLDETCLALQAIAGDNGIDADLRCQG